MVHPDEHFNHQSAVRKLHSTLYSSPFVLPKIYFAPPAPPIAAVAPARMSTVSQSPTSAHTSPVRTPTKRRLTGMQPSSPGSPCKRSAPVDLSVSVSYLDSLELDSTVYSEISSFADHAVSNINCAARSVRCVGRQHPANVASFPMSVSSALASYPRVHTDAMCSTT